MLLLCKKNKHLLFSYSDFGADITTNSAINLVNIEHLKHFDYLCLNTLSEQLDVETIFDFIIVSFFAITMEFLILVKNEFEDTLIDYMKKI